MALAEEKRSFLFRKYSRNVASTYFSYSRRFHRPLLSGNLSQLRLLSDEKQLHAMKTLSCLSKYLGIYSFFKELVKSHDLKTRTLKDIRDLLNLEVNN